MEIISVLYFYPNFIKINNEINLIRIVDNDLKECVIIFAEEKGNELLINITNTNVGEVVPVMTLENVDKLEIVVNKVRENESKIKSLKELSQIEKQLIKLFNC